MKIQSSLKRLLALSALASILAACGGGGGGGGAVPGTGATSKQKAPAAFTVFIPKALTPAGHVRKPQYIDPNGTSSLVVAVTPNDPAEFAQWGTIVVCYSLFTAGVQTPSAGVTITPVVGPPAGLNVNFNLPAPPGQDSFVVTQVAGACSPTNPYAAPTPGPGQTAASSIISQAGPFNANITAGTTNGGANGFNVQLAACTAQPGNVLPTLPVCPVPNPATTTTLTPVLGANVATVYMGGATPVASPLPNPVPLPIVAPVREQSAFLTALSQVGVPIPIVGLDGNGFPVPYTAQVPGGPAPTSGFLPRSPNNPACTGAVPVVPCTDNITIAHTEAGTGGPHGKLVLIDATTGAVAQNVEPITLHAVNGLVAGDIPLGGAANDPYVLVLLTDGAAATQITSYTVTLNATIGGTAIPAQTLTINPQATIYSTAAVAPANGYADIAGPYAAAADVINTNGTATGAAQGFWVSDGANLRQVGVATHAVAGATTLTGMNVDTFTGSAPAISPQILAVDNSTAAVTPGGAVPIAGGLYVFDPLAFTSKPLAIQNQTTGNWIALGKPVGVAYQTSGYVYVASGSGTITAIDPQSNGAGGLLTTGGVAFFQAEQIGNLTLTGTAPSFGSVSGIDMVFSGTKLLFADPGNSRIASIDLSTCGVGAVATPGPCAVTAFATGAAFVGLSKVGANFVASDTTGQLYSITAAGVVTSFGLTTGAVADGPIGVLTPPAAGASSYLVQGNAGNFFGSASTPTVPYNIPPFAAAGPVFAVAAQAAIAGAPNNLAPDTSNATITAASSGKTMKTFGVQQVTAAQATNASLTKDSYIFADNGNLRTLIP